MFKFPFLQKLTIFLGFAVLYSLVFYKLWDGVGNNWDWQFPYFSQHGFQLVHRQFNAWTPDFLGQPIGYNTPAYFFILSGLLATIMRPEFVQPLLLVLIFSTGSFIAFRFFREKFSVTPSLLFSLALFLNPAIFYKLLAGHLIYLAAYGAFVALLLYLLKLRTVSYKTAIVVGLLVALTTLQVQFFGFSYLLLIAFFIRNRAQLKWGPIIVALVLPLLINAHWLSQFLAGAFSVGQLSSNAKADAFADLMRASWKGIITLSFSGATFIRNFYPMLLLGFFSLFYLFPLAGLIKLKQAISGDGQFLLIMFGVFLIFATGIFNLLPIPGLLLFYPMFREVGHAAPIIILLLTLITVELVGPWERVRQLFQVYLVIFLALNAYVYYRHIPTVNFANARNAFSGFESFNDRDRSTHRILTYPFFNQYSIAGEVTDYRGSQPMANSGWDSYTTFSGKDNISNSTSPSKFTQSLQYRFLQSYDVGLLKPLGIKYIYDYSDIYSSNYDRFVASEIYRNDLSIIKNDPKFLDKVMVANPDQVTKVNSKVLEVLASPPRIDGEGVSFKKVNESRYEIDLSSSKSINIRFLSSFHSGWKLYMNNQSTVVGCEKVASNGSVKECLAPNKNIVGDEFNFLAKKPLEYSHQLKNGYANSWVVPVNGAQHLTLFYRPQAVYLLGWLVSFVTLISSILLLLITRLRRR